MKENDGMALRGVRCILVSILEEVPHFRDEQTTGVVELCV